MRQWSRALALALITLAIAGPACSTGQRFSGVVVGVADGDTISVMRDGRAVTVRLAGVDCPERAQAFGSRAKQFTSSLVFGRQVTVHLATTDRYGRLVGRVYEGRTDVSLELVRGGMAWHYRQYSNDRALREAEQEARSARRGLWADAHPTAPWEFRMAERHGGEEASAAGPDGSAEATAAGRRLAVGTEVGQRVEQTLGLSPAVAASPFLGLALLTGASHPTFGALMRPSMTM
jgi:micrococcal nuclease